MPVIAGSALAAAKSAAVGKAVEGVTGLFGDTPTDRARSARADRLLNAALNGDTGALRQLAYDAFEPRRGLVGDARTPRDGKYSPTAVRALARRALQRYVGGGGKLPSSMAVYADRIQVPVAVAELSVGEQLAGTVADAAGERAATAASAKIAEDFKRYLPVVLGVVVVVGVLYFVARRKAA